MRAQWAHSGQGQGQGVPPCRRFSRFRERRRGKDRLNSSHSSRVMERFMSTWHSPCPVGGTGGGETSSARRENGRPCISIRKTRGMDSACAHTGEKERTHKHTDPSPRESLLSQHTRVERQGVSAYPRPMRERERASLDGASSHARERTGKKGSTQIHHKGDVSHSTRRAQMIHQEHDQRERES